MANNEYMQLSKHFENHKKVLIANIKCFNEAEIYQFYEVHSYPQIINFLPDSTIKKEKFQFQKNLFPNKGLGRISPFKTLTNRSSS